MPEYARGFGEQASLTISRHQSKTLPAAAPVGVSTLAMDAAQTGPPAAQAGAPRTLHLVTFGCQMNKYDSERVEGRFRKAGYALTEDMGAADVIAKPFDPMTLSDQIKALWSRL